MKSIREYNTKGMELYEREDLYKITTPILIGETVYEAGGAWDQTKQITVTEENQKEISMFWNSIFFDTWEKAEAQTDIAHSNYSSWMCNAWR